MNARRLFILVLIFFLYPVAQASDKFNRQFITLEKDISDACITDLNNDGKKDLILIAGGFINIFYNKKNGYDNYPDQTFFYRNLGDYIDVGKLYPTDSHLSLIGVSKQGIKTYRYNGQEYEDRGFIIKTDIEIPDNRLSKIFNNFVLDVDGDGLGEIFVLEANNLKVYKLRNNKEWKAVIYDNLSGVSKFSSGQLCRENGDITFNLSFENKVILPINYLNINRQINLEKFGRANFSSDVGPEILGQSKNSGIKLDVNLDINSDKKNDLVRFEISDKPNPSIGLFPEAKVLCFINKNYNFIDKPDAVLKTTIIGEFFPICDLDGDGKLDFISIWPHFSIGSKENILSLLVNKSIKIGFRCFLFDELNGYTRVPNFEIQADINLDIPYFHFLAPFNISSDIDGDGLKDLAILKDKSEVYIYFLNIRAKKQIKRVELLKIEDGYEGFTLCDLNGCGKSDLIFVKDNKIKVYSWNYID